MSTSSLSNDIGTSDVLWNLDDLYASPNDEQINADFDFCRQEAVLLRRDCEGRMAELDSAAFALAVQRLERVRLKLARIEAFAFLKFAVQVTSSEASAFLQRIREDASLVSRNLIFFDLEWAKLNPAAADRLMAGDEIAPYRHFLANLRRQAAHLLSVPEERLLVELAPAGRESWLTLFEKVLARLKFGEKGRSEEEVLADLHDGSREVRWQAAQELTEGLRSQLHVLTHVFNAILAEKMIQDRLRRHHSWISGRNLANELEDHTVEALVAAVVGRYDIVQRYYRLKRDLLGLGELCDYDRYAPLPSLPTRLIPWQECRDMVLDGFRDFSPEMAEAASLFFERRWIHAPLGNGKQGGAFAHPTTPDVHPYVLVNYAGGLRDVSTVAHELGHGVHQHLARGMGYFNSDATLVLAETASVFAEMLVFRRQLDALSGKEERRAFICQKLESIFATVFRQISMNRFEDMIHVRRREQGELSEETLSELWLQSQRAMFGESVVLGEHYGLWWSYIPHFLHEPGYVYAYAFGELLVLSLWSIHEREGAAFAANYLRLLSQGGSCSPADLLKPFGINLSDPDFWLGGLRVVEEMLVEVEALA